MNIKLIDDHKKEQNQLIIAISGDKNEIKERLQVVINQIEAVYGKPIQGVSLGSNFNMEVYTPIWEGKAY